MKSIVRQCFWLLAFLVFAGFDLPFRAAAPFVDLRPSLLSLGSQVASTSSSSNRYRPSKESLRKPQDHENNSGALLWCREAFEIRNPVTSSRGLAGDLLALQARKEVRT